MTQSAIPGKIPDIKKNCFILLSVAYLATKPIIDHSCSNSISRVPLQISLAHFLNFRPTLKIKGSLHKKHANKLTVTNMEFYKHDCFCCYVKERPPKKYCYPSSDIHSL